MSGSDEVGVVAVSLTDRLVLNGRRGRCTGLVLHGRRGRQAGAARAAERPRLRAFYTGDFLAVQPQLGAF